jgi:quercetin dioxygenase-like cupin family protein
MLKESLHKKSSGKAKRLFKTSLSTFNLITLIEKMKDKLDLHKRDLHSMVLLNSPEKQIVLTAFDKGTEINSYQENEQMILHVIWGKLRFHTQEESLDLSRGELLTIQEKKPYILTTAERTVFLLTLFTGNMGQTNINFTDNEQEYNG